MASPEHIPVMLNEAVSLLNVLPHGIYVDATLGGGGHAEAVLQKLTTGRLLGIDQDAEAIAVSTSRLKKYANFTALKNSFHNLPKVLDECGVSKINGVLYDLGVSSFQIDTAKRGFSYRNCGPLDMRMDNGLTLTASDIVNTYTQKHIADILYMYGEERQAKKIAKEICEMRKTRRIETTSMLAQLIGSIMPKKRGDTSHPAMRSFMALRIAVNNEIDPLEDTIKSILPYLADDGRIVVITFHSIEDRIIKNIFKKQENPCTCPRDIPYCVCGNVPALKILTKKPITPAKSELASNTRSHSAKLRGAKKI